MQKSPKTPRMQNPYCLVAEKLCLKLRTAIVTASWHTKYSDRYQGVYARCMLEPLCHPLQRVTGVANNSRGYKEAFLIPPDNRLRR